MKILFVCLSMLAANALARAEMTWKWNDEPEDPHLRNQIADSMDRCVETWNAYSDYDYKIYGVPARPQP
jgi:hypothetical protein